MSSHYDPMLGKVIAFGATRESRAESLVDALDETAIVGLTTNVGFLRDLADSAAFRDAEIDTAWLDSQHDRPVTAHGDVAWALAAWSAAGELRRQPAGRARSASPTAGGSPARLRGSRRPVAAYAATHPSGGCSPCTEQPGRIVTRGPRAVDASGRGRALTAGCVLEIDGVLVRGLTSVDEHAVTVVVGGQQYVFDKPDVFAPDHDRLAGDGRITAPMPGTVLSVEVAAGQQVGAGDTLGVMEAMKMELSLTAPFDGVVAIGRGRWRVRRSNSAPSSSSSTPLAADEELTC